VRKIEVPKMKTHRGAAKRYKITGSGKVLCRKINRGHLLTKKSSCRKRHLASDTEITGPLTDRIENALGIRIKTSGRQRAARVRALNRQAAGKE
jgi:large subunit ribosomal protein L35